MKKVEKVSA